MSLQKSEEVVTFHEYAYFVFDCVTLHIYNNCQVTAHVQRFLAELGTPTLSVEDAGETAQDLLEEMYTEMPDLPPCDASPQAGPSGISGPSATQKDDTGRTARNQGGSSEYYSARDMLHFLRVETLTKMTIYAQNRPYLNLVIWLLYFKTSFTFLLDKV